MSLTDDELKVVSYIDQHYWENDGKVPTNEVIAQRLKLPVARVNKCWKSETFRRAVAARGINLLQEEYDGILLPMQIALANMLMNTHDKSSIREKLKNLNISTQQYTAWMNDPSFQAYLRKRAESAFKNLDPIAYNSLQQMVESKDFNALKLFFEMRGIYNPRIDVSVNVENVLQRVIEVVAKHVDPVTMAAIADELEGLTSSPAKLDSVTNVPVVRELPSESIIGI